VVASDRRKPGPSPRFTREELARLALAIMDGHSTGALTVRRLAQEAGMATTALYNYFPSKDDLLDAAIDAAAGEIELPEPSAHAWKEQLASVARAWFRAGLRHPGVARLRFDRPLQSSRALRVTDWAIAVLRAAGLTKPDAVAAFKALTVLTLGASAAATAESRPEERRQAAVRHASVAAAELPAMAAVAAELSTALGGDQAFEFGLAALLVGIEQRIAAARLASPQKD
jgi:TetR/AcrR family transcriptional regulator, tetracycline repressor protein